MNVGVDNPFWLVVFVGALSGLVGAIIGPIMQRTFARNDRALDARQAWVREKLSMVFGIDDELRSSDVSVVEPYTSLVPPSAYIPHWYNMHAIHGSVQESVELMMLQPRRSAWARMWLYQWHFILTPEAQFIHRWHDYLKTVPWDAPEREAMEARIERLAAQYEQRVRRVESSISIWATGQWITHPSWRIWLGGRQTFYRTRRTRLLRWEREHGALYDEPRAQCNCVDLKALEAMRRAETKWAKKANKRANK